MTTLWYVTITATVTPGKRKAFRSRYVVLADNEITAKDLAREEWVFGDNIASIEAEPWESSVSQDRHGPRDARRRQVMKSVIAKLGTMRKSTDWIVYPRRRTPTDDYATTLIIQSGSRICEFDAATGAGMLSAYRTTGAYFIHLSPLLGATPITVPAEVIAAVLDAQPKSGDSIGPGVTIA